MYFVRRSFFDNLQPLIKKIYTYSKEFGHKIDNYHHYNKYTVVLNHTFFFLNEQQRVIFRKEKLNIYFQYAKLDFSR